MNSIDTFFAESHARSEQACSGMGPALMGGTVLGALTLTLGLGWLAALAVGGSVVPVLLATLREPEFRPSVPLLLPVRVLP